MLQRNLYLATINYALNVYKKKEGNFMTNSKLVNNIEKHLLDFLNPLKKEFDSHKFDFKIESYQCEDNAYCIDIAGFSMNEYKNSELTKFILLKLCIMPEFKEIHIPNIFLQPFMQHHGIGKRIIGIIFDIAKKENYRLFIIDMVNSFYRKMIKRGAIPCQDVNGVFLDDVVEVTANTDLENKDEMFYMDEADDTLLG